MTIRWIWSCLFKVFSCPVAALYLPSWLLCTLTVLDLEPSRPDQTKLYKTYGGDGNWQGGRPGGEDEGWQLTRGLKRLPTSNYLTYLPNWPTSPASTYHYNLQTRPDRDRPGQTRPIGLPGDRAVSPFLRRFCSNTCWIFCPHYPTFSALPVADSRCCATDTANKQKRRREVFVMSERCFHIVLHEPSFETQPFAKMTPRYVLAIYQRSQ